jgi:5-methylcytosine-specific restriction endonuclease McrA
MPAPKHPCPDCGTPTRSTRCRSCTPPYERTAEHRATMSQAQTGKRHSYRSASTRPEVAAKIQDWWTPERREARRQAMLAKNPDARYHGLSAREAKRIRDRVGSCQECGATGRLDIHHKDGDKQNQSPENLTVLCRSCHMQVHAERGETGWDVYHRNRTNRPR